MCSSTEAQRRRSVGTTRTKELLVSNRRFGNIGKDGVSHFELLQNALRDGATLLYCAFDLMFADAEDDGSCRYLNARSGSRPSFRVTS